MKSFEKKTSGCRNLLGFCGHSHMRFRGETICCRCERHNAGYDATIHLSIQAARCIVMWRKKSSYVPLLLLQQHHVQQGLSLVPVVSDAVCVKKTGKNAVETPHTHSRPPMLFRLCTLLTQAVRNHDVGALRREGEGMQLSPFF